MRGRWACACLLAAAACGDDEAGLGRDAGGASDGDPGDSAAHDGGGAACSSGLLSSWTAGASLPAPRHGLAIAASADQVWALGGFEGRTAVREVYAARLSEDGALGEWSETTALPDALDHVAAFVTDARVCVVGAKPCVGADCPPSRVLCAETIGGGNLGPWEQGPDLPEARGDVVAIRAGRAVFVLGGSDVERVAYPNVLRGEIGDDGSVAAWSVAGTLPAEVSGAHPDVASYAASAGRAFVLVESPLDAPRVWAAAVSEESGVGTWATTGAPLDGAPILAALVVAGSHLFVLGGARERDGDDWAAPVDTAGTLGDWRAVAHVPEPLGAHRVVAAGRYLHVVGGFVGRSTDSSAAVWSALLCE